MILMLRPDLDEGRLEQVLEALQALGLEAAVVEDADAVCLSIDRGERVDDTALLAIDGVVEVVRYSGEEPNLDGRPRYYPHGALLVALVGVGLLMALVALAAFASPQVGPAPDPLQAPATWHASVPLAPVQALSRWMPPWAAMSLLVGVGLALLFVPLWAGQGDANRRRATHVLVVALAAFPVVMWLLGGALR